MSDTQFNYYQPLSHALNPPRSSSQSEYFKPPQPPQQEQSKQPESDDDDEGTVEEQLSRTSLPSSPKQQSSSHFDRQPSSTQDPEPRRRGRPRGSKNRRGRIPSTPTVKSPSNNQPVHPTGQGTNPPQLPEVTPQNQQYYEFQWRVLNLCAEFYGAAEELVKATPALVIAQCYQMGPNSKVDPLNMLSEAKQICDTLLANPSRLITSPPPPMYPVVPTFYAAPSNIPTTTGAPTVISQPQSFVVSMGSSTYPAVYATNPTQYPTASYYQYPYGHPGAYYAAPPPPAAPPPIASGSSAPAPQVQTSNAGNSGTWSDEETEQLKKLADEKKTNTGEIDWDQVVNEWGNTRSRHQILIKATQLGLKESSSGRGIKRRRETDNNSDAVGSTSAAPTPVPMVNASNSSSTPSSTPMPSPSLQNQQQPHISKPPLSVTTAPPSNQPWPMPVVAVNTVSSPVIGSSASGSDHRVTSYYRPRPTASPKPSPANQQQQQPLHRYIYQTNGHHTDNPK